jgi:hypothetical protein
MAYKMKKELMGGDEYWMIYQRRFIFSWSFYERWNSYWSCKNRIYELNN